MVYKDFCVNILENTSGMKPCCCLNDKDILKSTSTVQVFKLGADPDQI